MKICLINNLYRPLNRGGAEKITETIARGLFEAGHEILIITTKPYFNPLPRLKDEAADQETPIYYLNSFYYSLNKFPKIIRFGWHLWDMFDIASYFKIKKILKKAKCEAVITNNLMGVGYLTALAIKKLKLKQIHIVHDIQLIHPSGIIYWGQENIVNGLAAGSYYGLSRWLFGSPKAVIFPSRWLRDMYLDKTFFIKSQRIILPNPVEATSPARGLKNDNIFRFLYLGQIEKHKGLDLLIRAFKKVSAKNGQKVELVIAGNGSAFEQAKIIAGQSDNIKFLSWPGEEQADKLMNESDCLVYPSLVYENCPNAIQRALVAGLPVLATDLGGIAELLSHGAGILFKPADLIDLADKMEWAVNNQNDLTDIISTGKKRAALYRVDSYIKELERLIMQQ